MQTLIRADSTAIPCEFRRSPGSFSTTWVGFSGPLLERFDIHIESPGRREVADPWPASQGKPPIGRLAFQIKERMNLILRFPFPRVGSRCQLGSVSSKHVQTGEATPVEDSHSANTSCSVLNVAVSVFGETTPSFFPNRVLSRART